MPSLLSLSSISGLRVPSVLYGHPLMLIHATPITDPSLNHACNIPSVTEGDTVTGDEHLGTGTLPTRCHTDTALAGQGGRAGPGRTG